MNLFLHLYRSTFSAKHAQCGQWFRFELRKIVAFQLIALTATLSADNSSIDSGSWFTPTNWEDELGVNQVPQDGDGEAVTRVTNDSIISIEAGSASVNNILTIGDENGAGTLNLTGGNLDVSETILVGDGGTGEFTVSGTLADPVTLNMGNDLIIGTDDVDSVGTVLINGTDTTVVVEDAIGTGTGKNSNSSLTLGGSAQVTVLDNVRLGLDDDTQTFFRIEDNAVLNVTNEINLAEQTGNRAVNTIEIAGGTITAGNNLITERQGALAQTNITMTAGVVNVNQIAWEGQTTVNMSGGSLTADDYLAGNSLNAGTNMFTQSAGTVTMTDSFSLSHDSHYVLEGGQLDVGGNFLVLGDDGILSTFEQTGGDLILRGVFAVASTAGSLGDFRMSGGTLTLTQSEIFSVGFSGEGTATFSNDVVINSPGIFSIGRLENSDGTMTLEDNASLSFTANPADNIASFLGAEDGSVGRLILKDNSALTNNGGMVLADNNGEGSIEMSDQSRLDLNTNGDNIGRLIVGQGGAAQVTLTENSQIEAESSVFVGFSADGNGRLEVADTAKVLTDLDIVAGLRADSEGIIVIEGGTLSATDDIRIGSEGKGQLDINSTTTTPVAVSTGDEFFIATNEGSEGTVNITGGTVMVGDNLRIANSGIGELNVNGSADTPAIVNVSGLVSIGLNLNGQGTVNLGGTHTTLTSAEEVTLGEGENSVAIVNLSDNAVVNANGDVTLGLGSGSVSTLNLSNNGVFNANTGVSLGEGVGSVSTLNILDNAQLLVSDSFKAGDFGAEGITTEINLSGGNLTVTNEVDFDGSFTGNFTGGTLNAGSDLSIGGSTSDGDETVLVNQSGGVVATDTDFFLASFGGASTYNISAGSLEVGGTLDLAHVGDLDDPSVNFNQSGGSVVSDQLAVFGGTGDVTYFLSAGTLEVDTLFVGSFGFGALFGFEEELGEVLFRQTGGQVDVDTEASNIGKMEIAGGIFNAPKLSVGFEVDFEGIPLAQGGVYDQTDGTVSVDELSVVFGSTAKVSGGELNVGTKATVDATSTLELTGGSFTVAADGESQNNGIIKIGGSAEVDFQNITGDGVFEVDSSFTGKVIADEIETVLLAGNGEVEGNVTANGLLSPGASAGSLDIIGDLSMTSSNELEIEIGGLIAGTDYDQINVSGTSTLGGDLSLTLLDGFTPNESDVFTIVSSAFLMGDFTGLQSGQSVDVSIDGETDPFGSFRLFYGAGSVFNAADVVLTDFSVVPEPSFYVSMLGVFAALFTVCSRRRCGKDVN